MDNLRLKLISIFSKSFFAQLVLTIAIAQLAFAQDSAQSYDLAIVNASIVSPEREGIVEGAIVLIRDGRIETIQQGDYAFQATETIDGAGYFLTPGLIDSHVHLYHATGLKPRYTQEFDSLYEAYLAQMPKSYLYHGFTTLIELNADTQTNNQFLATPVHPDLHHCSAGLILSDGYMASEIPKGELLKRAPNFLHDRYSDGYLPAGVNPEEHTPKATVARIAAAGAVCVKLYYEEAIWMPSGAPDIALPSEQIIREVVREAHGLGLTVVMHGTSAKGQEFARHTGVDVIAHGPWDWQGNDYANPEIPNAIKHNIGATGAAGMYIQPTISALQHTASMFKPALLNDAALENVLGAEFINYLRTEGQIQRTIFLEVFGAAIVADPTEQRVAPVMLAMIERYKQMVGLMSSARAKLLMGSDTSSGGFGWGNPPGLTGFWEMKDWADSGVPLKDIFAAATIGNAKAFGLASDIGTVEVGKRANLLLLRSNPLQDINAYNSIELVVLHGTAIERSVLSAKNRQ